MGEPVDLGEPVTSAPLTARLRVPSGPLFFPVTAYGPDGAVDLDAYRAHVRQGVEAGAAAVFACCGTGEFHALTPEEFQECVRAAVAETAGRVPVVAGAGYGTALAVRYARLAEEAGADGLLAMPPYLVVAAQEGLLRHYRELAAATSLPVVVYQRDNAVFTPETVVELARTEGIVGLKDGVGDLDLMTRIVSAVRGEAPGPDDFLYFNGLPTAELTQPAYRAVGVPCTRRPSSASYRRSPSRFTGRSARETMRSWNGCSTGSTVPSSNSGPGDAAMPCRWSRPGYGYEGWTWEKYGRRCTSRQRNTSSSWAS